MITLREKGINQTTIAWEINPKSLTVAYCEHATLCRTALVSEPIVFSIDEVGAGGAILNLFV